MTSEEEYIEKIKGLLKNHPKGLTTDDIAKKLPLNRTSTAKYLNTLVLSGLVELHRVGPAKIFTLTRRIPVSQILSLYPDPVILMDQERIIREVNSRFLTVFSLVREDLVGKQFDATILDQDIKSFLLPRICHAVAGQESINVLKVMHGSDELYFKSKYLPVVFDEGHPGAGVILEDITETQTYQQNLEREVKARTEELSRINEKLQEEIRAHETSKGELQTLDQQLARNIEELQVRQIEREKQHQELICTQREAVDLLKKYIDLYDNAPVGYFTLDKDGVILAVNRCGMERLARDDTPLAGQKFEEFICESSRPAFQSFRSRVLSNKTSEVCDVELPESFGKSAWYAHIEGRLEQADGDARNIRLTLSDITGRKLAEDAFQMSLDKYRDFFRTSRDCVFITSYDGHWIDLNDAAVELFGYSSLEQLMQTRVMDVYANPSDRDRHIRFIAQRGYSREFPVNLKRKDQTIINALITSVPRHDPDGRVIGFQGTIRDITERTRAEDALRESEARLQSIFHGSPILQFVINRNHKVILWNHAIEKISGITADAIIGTDGHWGMFYPDKRPCLADLLVDNAIEQLPEWYEGKIKKSTLIEGAYEAVDFFPLMGESGRWLYFTAAPFLDARGAIIGAIETLVDVSDRKIIEEKLAEDEQKIRALLDQTFQSICLITPDGTLLEANQTALEFAGIAASDVIGRPFWDTPWWTHSVEMQEKLKNAIRDVAGGKFRRFEVTHRAADGSLHYFDFSLKPVINDCGNVVYLIPEGRDITDQKAAEEELQIQARIIDQTHDSIITTDMEGMVTSWNKGAERMYGYTAQESLGRHISFLYPESEIDVLKYDVIAPLIEQGSHEIEVRLRRKSGNLFYALLSLSLLTDDNGTPLRMIGYSLDITDRKVAERMIRQSEARFRGVTERISDVIILTNEQGTATYVSPSVQNVLGYTPADMEGKTLGDFVTAEDYATVATEFQKNITGIVTDCPEVQVRKSNGEYSIVEIAGSPVYKNNRIVGAQIVCRDLTARRMAERQRDLSNALYQGIFTNTLVGVCHIGPDGNLLRANEKAAQILGFDSPDDAVAAVPNFYDWIDLPAENRSRLEKELQETGLIENAELCLCRNDGKAIWILANLRQITSPDGNVLYHETMFHNITSLKDIENGLRQAHQQLSLINSITRSDILESTAGMLENLHFARSKYSDTRIDALIEKLESSTKNIKYQVESSHGLTEMGVQEPQWQRPQDFVADLQLPAAVTITSDLEGIEVYADIIFRKVFFELLDNSLYHGNRVTAIHISIRKSPSGLVITWEDNGIGIPDASKETIFEPGYGNRSGLGLFLIRKILGITGMTIRETGIEGNGARFEIMVPKGAFRKA